MIPTQSGMYDSLELLSHSHAEAPGQRVPLPNVASKILARVIEYCTYHVQNSKDSKASSSQATKSEDEIKAWDADFMKVDQGTLFEIILVCSHHV